MKILGLDGDLYLTPLHGKFVKLTVTTSRGTSSVMLHPKQASVLINEIQAVTNK